MEKFQGKCLQCPYYFAYCFQLLLWWSQSTEWTQRAHGITYVHSFEICFSASELFDHVNSSVKGLSEGSGRWQNNKKLEAVPVCFAFGTANSVYFSQAYEGQHVHKQNSPCTDLKKMYLIRHASLKHKWNPVRCQKDGDMGKDNIEVSSASFSQNSFFPTNFLQILTC